MLAQEQTFDFNLAVMVVFKAWPAFWIITCEERKYIWQIALLTAIEDSSQTLAFLLLFIHMKSFPSLQVFRVNQEEETGVWVLEYGFWSRGSRVEGLE